MDCFSLVAIADYVQYYRIDCPVVEGHGPAGGLRPVSGRHRVRSAWRRMPMVRGLCGISSAAFLAAAACFATSATAAPIQPVQIGKAIGSDVQQASFWGLPYPYGYAYRDGYYTRRVYHR